MNEVRNGVYRKSNEYRPQLLNIISIVPFARANTSTRMGMLSSQSAQCLIPKGIEPPRCQTGILREFGNYTFAIEMPCDAEVLKVIPMYQTGIGDGKIKDSPVTHVLYRDIKRNEIEYLEIPKIHLLDNKFGFRYKEKIRPFNLQGKFIEKGTIISDTPAKLDGSQYCQGLEANELLGSFSAVTEDGSVISEDLAKRLTYTSFFKCAASLKRGMIPRNLYGNKNRFQAFPNIGEYVNPDGLLMAFFMYDPETAPVEMTAEALMEVDYFYDSPIYIQSDLEKAKVVDIRVFKESSNTTILPYGMEAQLEQYLAGNANSYKEIYDEYRRQVKASNHVGLSPKVGKRLQLNILGKHFINEARKGSDGKIVRTYSQSPIDGYTIMFVIECETVPTFGTKLSTYHADKTIVVEVWPTERMPIDEDGNRVDILRDDKSTIKRQNPGLLHEGMLNASSRDLVRNLRQKVGLGRRVKDVVAETRYISELPQTTIEAIWDEYLEFLSLLLPSMYDAYTDPRFVNFNMRDALTSLFIDGHYSIVPCDDPLPLDRILELCNTKYPSTYGYVQFIDAKGKTRVLRKKASIVNRHYLLLDKVPSSVSAVASARLNHFGCPVRISNEERYRTPIPHSPIRLFGEYEHQVAGAALGGEMMADINDQSNNPLSHKEIVSNFITSEKPTAIYNALSRDKIPLGEGRSLQLVHHISDGAGIGYYRMDDPYEFEYRRKQKENK